MEIASVIFPNSYNDKIVLENDKIYLKILCILQGRISNQVDWIIFQCVKVNFYRNSL